MDVASGVLVLALGKVALVVCYVILVCMCKEVVFVGEGRRSWVG